MFLGNGKLTKLSLQAWYNFKYCNEGVKTKYLSPNNHTKC
jgi:hypothetical protein